MKQENNILKLQKEENKKVERFAQVFNFNVNTTGYVPKFVESTNNEWVTYGKNNKYPLELIQLYNESALHSAILKSIINQVKGSGLRIKNKVEDKALQDWMQLVNLKNESLYDVVEKMVYDFCMYGGFSTSNIWKKGKGGFEIYHTDFSTLRSGKAHEVTGYVDKFYFSSDWTKGTQSKITPYPTFSLEQRSGTQINYVVPYTSGLKYYPLPIYQSVIGWAKLDTKICDYYNSITDNGFFPSLSIVYRNGIPTPERQQQVFDDLIASFEGQSNAGKVMLSFADNKDTAPEITAIGNNDNDSKFIEICKIIFSQIISGYRIPSPELVGISTPGQLGVSDLAPAQELFFRIVIEPLQSMIEKEVNKLVKANGFENEIEIIPIQPVSYTLTKINDQVFNVLTINEVRELLGMESIAGGDVIVNSAKPVSPEQKPDTQTPKTETQNEPDPIN